jgi:ABC-type sugar transport system ATPase subunit
MNRRGEGAGNDPLVRLVGASKLYPGIRALDRVDLDFRAGEIHSIVGENGAGKSTLVRLLAGLDRPSSGAIEINGAAVRLRNPAAARRVGVRLVPQEASLVPNLSVGRNVLLGKEGRWSSRSRLTARERTTVTGALSRVGAETLDIDQLATALPVASVRLAQIAATLIDPGRLLILDEPTAVLSDVDAERLLQRLERLREEGISILYVSHRLGEVQRLSDRTTVMRDGAVIGTFDRGTIDRAEMLRLMARSTMTAASRPAEAMDADEDADRVLVVDRLNRDGAFYDVSFEARVGEVVGIAGIQGSGHGQLVDVIAGAVAADSGRVHVDGEVVHTGSRQSALRAGIRVVPEERRERGIVAPRSIRENMSIGFGSAAQARFVRRPSLERATTRQAIGEFGVYANSGEVAIGTLSGGNQQKVVIARVLASNPRVMLLSEPTQGIDVRAKAEILGILRRAARERGIAIVLASSEFEELLEFTDVIHVMRLGRIVDSIRSRQASYSQVLEAAVP